MKIQDLLKEGAIYTFVEVAAKLTPFLLLPYMTRVMGSVELGEYSLFQSGIAFFSIVLCFSCDAAIARYYYFYGSRAIDGLIDMAIFLACILFSILVIFFYNSAYIYSLLAALALAIYNIRLSLYQASRRVTVYGVSQMLVAVFTVISTIVLFNIVKASAELRVIASGFAWLVGGGYLYLKGQRRKRPVSMRVKKIMILYLLGYGLPILVHSISTFLKGNIDRFIVSEAYGNDILGVYYLGNQVAALLLIGLMAANKAWVPHFYQLCKDGLISKPWVYKACKYCLFIIPMPIVVSLFVPESWYSFVFGQEYSESAYYATAFIAGYAFLAPYFIVVNFLFYYKFNFSIAVVTICSSILHLILVYYFSLIDIRYMPFATLVSNIFQVIFLLYMVSRTNVDQRHD